MRRLGLVAMVLLLLAGAVLAFESGNESFEGAFCSEGWSCGETVGVSTSTAESGARSARINEGDFLDRELISSGATGGFLDYAFVPYQGTLLVAVCNAANECVFGEHPDQQPGIPWEYGALDLSSVLPAPQLDLMFDFAEDAPGTGARALIDSVFWSFEALPDAGAADAGAPTVADAGAGDAGVGDAGPADQGFGALSWDMFERTALGPAWRLLRPLAQIVDGGIGFGDSGDPFADAVFAVWNGYQFTTANQCSTVVVPDSYLGPSEMIQVAVRVDVDLCGNNQACRYGGVFDTNPGEFGWRIKADGYLFGIGNYDAVEENPTTSEVFSGPTEVVPGMVIQLCAQDVEPTELTLRVDGQIVVHVFDYSPDQRVSGQPGIFCVYGVPGQPAGGAGTKCVESWQAQELP